MEQFKETQLYQAYQDTLDDWIKSTQEDFEHGDFEHVLMLRGALKAMRSLKTIFDYIPDKSESDKIKEQLIKDF